MGVLKVIWITVGCIVGFGLAAIATLASAIALTVLIDGTMNWWREKKGQKDDSV